MKLQILVPQYKEDEGVVGRLLDSIAIQQCIDFSDVMVIICGDGGGVYLSQDFLNMYPFKVVYMSTVTNRGISATRNTLMDVATAEYIMFCDADDMFLNVFGIWKIFEDIKDGVDLYVSPFSEETRHPVTGKPYFVTHQEDGVFVHGKVYNLQWLRDEGIRWNEALTVHEDSYFNLLCYKLAKRLKIGEMIFYCWKWRDDSICRRDRDYLLKTYDRMIDSSDALVAEFIRREKKEEGSYYAAYMMYDIFFLLNRDGWRDPANVGHRERVERRYKAYHDKWGELICTVEPKHERQIIMDLRRKNYKNGVYLEKVTFDDWIRHIENEVRA